MLNLSIYIFDSVYILRDNLAVWLAQHIANLLVGIRALYNPWLLGTKLIVRGKKNSTSWVIHYEAT